MQRFKRAIELETLIKKHQALYYNEQPEITDEDFDALWDELKKIEPENSLFFSMPEESSENFAKAQHIVPMGSQDKAANPEQFSEWAAKMPFHQFIVQYKLDGASIELQYNRGILVKAVTRGNGKIGDDITANAKKMNGVLLELKGESGPMGAFPFSGGVRGEVIMTKFVHSAHYSDKANCRNAANGLMKRKDGSGSEHLSVICYDAVQGSAGNPFTGYAPFSTETEKLDWLKKSGFTTVPLKICCSIKEVIDYRASVMDLRASLDFDIDGLVIKSDEIDEADAKRVRPEKQIAFKFSLEEAVTFVREIEWSESGSTYTPIALIDPVKLAGTTVKRASLANPNIIKELNLQIGSKVVVTKRGEIIPKIEALIENTSDCCPIIVPDICTSCGASLVNEGTRLFCPNVQCPKLILHKIKKWINVLDIRSFGDKLIYRLFEAGKIGSIPSLYKLSIEDISSIDRMGELSAAKVYNALHEKNEIPLTQFIAGFDIDGIGELTVEKLNEAGFDSLQKLFETDEASFSAVYQIGDVLAHTLVTSLATLKPEMEELLREGFIRIKESKKGTGHLAGLSFCFTGELNSMKRSEAKTAVKNAGGIAKSSVVKGLTFLVTNTPESGSSKNKKAVSLGIKIINENDFLALLQTGLEK